LFADTRAGRFAFILLLSHFHIHRARLLGSPFVHSPSEFLPSIRSSQARPQRSRFPPQRGDAHASTVTALAPSLACGSHSLGGPLRRRGSKREPWGHFAGAQPAASMATEFAPLAVLPRSVCRLRFYKPLVCRKFRASKNAAFGAGFSAETRGAARTHVLAEGPGAGRRILGRCS
jgi:hypothetical protein